jgi:hypothetical protein
VDLAADGQPVGDARNSEAAVFVGGALIGGGGLVSGERLQSGVNDGAIFGRTVHHRRTRRRGSARRPSSGRRRGRKLRRESASAKV